MTVDEESNKKCPTGDRCEDVAGGESWELKDILFFHESILGNSEVAINACATHSVCVSIHFFHGLRMDDFRFSVGRWWDTRRITLHHRAVDIFASHGCHLPDRLFVDLGTDPWTHRIPWDSAGTGFFGCGA